jgi:hypothetical protein
MSALLGAWHRTRRSVTQDETTHAPRPTRLTSAVELQGNERAAETKPKKGRTTTQSGLQER